MNPLSRLARWLKRRLRFRAVPSPAPVTADLPAAAPMIASSAWADFAWPPGISPEAIRAIEANWRAEETRRHRELATRAITATHRDFARRGVLLHLTITAAPTRSSRI